MTLPPTTLQQTTVNANTDAKKHHCQEDSQAEDAADGVDTVNGIEAIDGNEAVIKAIDNVKAINASKAAEENNVCTKIKSVKAIENARGDVNLYAMALIHSLNVHEDATDATITAENTRNATPL